MGERGQLIDVFVLTLAAIGKFLNQPRQPRPYVIQKLVNLWSRRNIALNHPIQQVLDSPCQFTQHQRPNHTSTALEGVKSPAQLRQRYAVGRVGDPLRQGVMQGDQHLIGLFQKDLQQFFIQRLFIHRRRQQTAGEMQCRRVQRRQWAGQYIGQTLHHLRVVQRL